jgi:FMN phosphatase YigB (HAD superfamily)
MNIKTIFFDTSDTLYHSVEFQEAQSRRPIELLSKTKNISFDQAEELFTTTEIGLKETTPHVTKVAIMMNLGISRLDMQEDMALVDPGAFLEPDPKLNMMLQKLSQNYELGIITNVLKKAVDKILSALALDSGMFTHFVSVDNTQNSKPHSEPFLKAIKLSDNKPEQCVYVGDSITKDLIPAKQVGMKTIWVSQGQSYEGPNIDSVATTIYDVQEALKEL